MHAACAYIPEALENASVVLTYTRTFSFNKSTKIAMFQNGVTSADTYVFCSSRNTNQIFMVAYFIVNLIYFCMHSNVQDEFSGLISHLIKKI